MTDKKYGKIEVDYRMSIKSAGLMTSCSQYIYIYIYYMKIL